MTSQLVVVDVGHGNAAVITDVGFTAVVDVGLGGTLLQYLMDASISRIDFLVVSHADADHCGALVHLLWQKNLTFGTVLANPDHQKMSETWKSIEVALDRASREGRIDKLDFATAGLVLVGPNDLRLEVLSPSKGLVMLRVGGTDSEGRPISSNTKSAVVRLARGKKNLAVLPGDLDGVGLKRLLEEGVNLQAPILVFPHHGGLPGGQSPVAFAKDILSATKPSKVVFSVGRNSATDAHRQIVSTIRSEVPATYMACTQMPTHCGAGNDGTLPHVLPLFGKGKEAGACCAGSIAVDIDATPELPQEKIHLDYLGTVATPACAGWKT